MAIVTEQVEINGRTFNYTYSDTGRYVVGGFPYGEYKDAYDPIDLDRTYIEGNIITDGSEDADFAEAGKILLGVIE